PAAPTPTPSWPSGTPTWGAARASTTIWWRSVQRELVADVGVGEAERGVEAVRVRTRLVGGELHQGAAARPGPVDRPGDHLPAEALAARRRGDPDGLDLAALGAQAGQPGEVGELHGAHDLPLALGHDQLVVRV